MVIGQYRVKVGDKSRIAFPKRFREELSDRLVITYGFEGSLIIVSQANWKQLLDGSESKSFLESSARDTRRFLLGGATVVELDAQGRFVLPEYLRAFASIGEEVVFLGQEKYVEVWDGMQWETYQKNMEGRIEEVAEKLVRSIEKEK